jgi:hypothetical protein
MPGGHPTVPMDLGNMRSLGVHSLNVTCIGCRHKMIVNADPWPNDVTVLSFAQRMVCVRCGRTNAEVRPNWKECEANGPRGNPLTE